MSHIRTIIIISTDSGSEHEAEVRVEYRHYAGCGPTREHPGDDPETEILSIAVKEGDKWVKVDWLDALLAEDEGLLGLCQQDWAEEREAAAEYRAEARRDDRMMEGY